MWPDGIDVILRYPEREAALAQFSEARAYFKCLGTWAVLVEGRPGD